MIAGRGLETHGQRSCEINAKIRNQISFCTLSLDCTIRFSPNKDPKHTISSYTKRIKKLAVGFGALSAVLLQDAGLCNATPCRLVKSNRRFGGFWCCIYLDEADKEDLKSFTLTISHRDSRETSATIYQSTRRNSLKKLSLQ